MATAKLAKFLPFLVMDGAIILTIFLLMQLDWIVNNTLYNYGLVFNLDWVMPYRTALRISLGLLGFTLVATTIIGYISCKKAKEETAKTVFICKSCGNALTKLSGNISVKESTPEFKITKKCPFCDKKLLEK